MSEQVKRYDARLAWQEPIITESTDGEWVRHTDYAALLAERDRLAGEVKLLKERHEPKEEIS